MDSGVQDVEGIDKYQFSKMARVGPGSTPSHLYVQRGSRLRHTQQGWKAGCRKYHEAVVNFSNRSCKDSTCISSTRSASRAWTAASAA